MNKFQWNFNQNSNSFIHENAFEMVVCEMAAILPGPQCVNSARVGPICIWHVNLAITVPAHGLAPLKC